MKKEPEYLARNITLKKEHLEWIRKNYINLSRFVRTKIEEEMKKRQGLCLPPKRPVISMH